VLSGIRKELGSPVHIAYVMSRFPHLPETFILREMAALEAIGHHLSPYPLLLQRQQVMHQDARPWLARTRTFSLGSRRLLVANLKALLETPRHTITLWYRMVWSLRRSPAFLARALYVFPQAVAASRAMLAEDIEHIHAHYATHPALFAWLIHHLTGLSYSVTVHAHDIFVNQTMLGPKLREAAFIVAISKFNRDFLAHCLGNWVLAKTQVVHCGIAPDNYHVAPAPRSDIPRPLEIVSVGSLQPYKGHRYLLAALGYLRDDGIPFRCRIAGEGEERGQLEALLTSSALEGHVTLLGACTETEVASLLATGNCYVQPSIATASGKMEGIPVAIMEALASSLPVIASELSGIPELIQAGKTGYLVPPGDAATLAETLKHVYHHPAEARALALAGRALVAEQFDLQKNARQLSSLFAMLRPASYLIEKADI